MRFSTLTFLQRNIDDEMRKNVLMFFYSIVFDGNSFLCNLYTIWNAAYFIQPFSRTNIH